MSVDASEVEIAAAQAVALARVYASQPEHAWQSEVEGYLCRGGWAYVHLRDSRRQNATGWPDLFAVRLAPRPRALAIELKTQRGRTTPGQERWLALLAAVGVETHVWRPAQVDEVRRVLLAVEGEAQP